MKYAFPKRTQQLLEKFTNLETHYRNNFFVDFFFLLNPKLDNVASLPNIKKYLESARRQPFTLHGIFRNYPELDLI